MCQPITPPQTHPTLLPRRPQRQQNLPGCLRTKAQSPISTAAFPLQLPHPSHAPRSVNLARVPLRPSTSAPRLSRLHTLDAPRPDPAAPSCVRNVHTGPHAGVPLLARPSLLGDSEAGGCPLDPTADSSSTRPRSGCLRLVNLKAALPGAETEQIAAARADRESGARFRCSSLG